MSVPWDILDDIVTEFHYPSQFLLFWVFYLLVLYSVKYQKTVMIKTCILTLTHDKFKKKVFMFLKIL